MKNRYPHCLVSFIDDIMILRFCFDLLLSLIVPNRIFDLILIFLSTLKGLNFCPIGRAPLIFVNFHFRVLGRELVLTMNDAKPLGPWLLILSKQGCDSGGLLRKPSG